MRGRKTLTCLAGLGWRAPPLCTMMSTPDEQLPAARQEREMSMLVHSAWVGAGLGLLWVRDWLRLPRWGEVHPAVRQSGSRLSTAGSRRGWARTLLPRTTRRKHVRPHQRDHPGRLTRARRLRMQTARAFRQIPHHLLPESTLQSRAFSGATATRMSCGSLPLPNTRPGNNLPRLQPDSGPVATPSRQPELGPVAALPHQLEFGPMAAHARREPEIGHVATHARQPELSPAAARPRQLEFGPVAAIARQKGSGYVHGARRGGPHRSVAPTPNADRDVLQRRLICGPRCHPCPPQEAGEGLLLRPLGVVCEIQ